MKIRSARKASGDSAFAESSTANVTGPTPRDSIIAGARRLFLTSGFKRISMDELARELGMSKKTLYVQFSSKDDLLRAVMESKFVDVDRDLGEVLARKDLSMPEQLKILLTRLQGHVHEIHPAFVRDMQRNPELFAMIDERRQEIIRKYFGALLEKGRKEGAVRRDVPVLIMVEMLLGAARSIVNPTRLAQLNLTPQKAFSQVLSVFLNGILKENAE